MTQHHDMIIRGGTVIDGTKAPRFDADLAIDGGRISAIGDLAGPPWLAHKASHEGVHCVEHIAGLIPDEWLEPAATGSSRQCVDRIRKEFDYGADAVILHGATPDELEPVVAEYRQTLP